MRAVVQRVSRAAVRLEGDPGTDPQRAIDQGLLVLLGVHTHDATEPEAAARWLATKVANLRVFADAQGRMNRSVLDDGLHVLVVSQFTLYGDCRKGRRPNFMAAARPEVAEPAYLRFCEILVELGVTRVRHGVFGATMHVQLVNDGPVTLVLDSPG